MMPLGTTLRKHPRRFQKIILTYYQRHGRILPWRATTNPYHILVSEIMLQQTQVDRVIEKYKAFIKEFPSFAALAHTPLNKVLTAWQGLGYNRRALALKKAAALITKKHHGKLPDSPEELEKLPGIGPATAASIAAFAFNKPAVFIETNIRTIFIHFFFPKRTNVHDHELLPFIEETLDKNNPRRWYWALMDYGTMLKKKHTNPSRRSLHYTKQSPFVGSNRQLRGAIIKTLTATPTIRETQLLRTLNAEQGRVRNCLVQLQGEGFIQKKGPYISIKT